MFEDFYRDLKSSITEKDVENTYRTYITKYYGVPITSPYNTDGLLTTKLKYDGVTKQLILLMEFKDDKNIKLRTEMMKIIIQVIYYLKSFENAGEIVPNVVLVADKNEAFVLHANSIINYLNEDIDWSLAPSNAHKNNPNLLNKLIDSTIYPFVFDINETFVLEELFNKISDITAENERQIRITEKNISKIYEYFIMNVVKDYQKYDTNTLVYSFIEMMKEKDLVFREKKSTLLLSNNEEIKVDRNNYKSFIIHFLRDYSPVEEKKFTEIADRLIEETNRRKQGAYFTPTAFVDYTHKLLAKNLGEMWNREFLVWDSAWGTGNLTRDEYFNNLYASTINQSELDTGILYNQGSVKFQYDFLNDDVDEVYRITQSKMPEELSQSLENKNKKILFYINPPYGTGGNANSSTAKSKKDLAKTEIADLMRENKLFVSEQLFAQFLFRIINIKLQSNNENIYIGLFAPTIFLTGSKYKAFRKVFFKNFELIEGSMFRADHFADVKSNWAISFTIWKARKSSDKEIQTEYTLKILDIDENTNVIEVGSKVLWNLDNDVTLQEWISSKDNGIETKKDQLIPRFSSSFKYSSKAVKTHSEAIGVLVNDTNNIEATTKGVYLIQSPISRNLKLIYITHKNFEEANLTLASRKLYKANWINQKNEYSAPNEDHELYKKYCVNCAVYAIFSNANNIISYRGIEIDNVSYNKRNEWFFMSNNEIKELASNSNSTIYNDSFSYGGETVMYKYLSENKHLLLDSAKNLIIKATKLVRETFNMREILNIDYPQYHINTWDAGWNQIKQLSILTHQEEFSAFNNDFKSFEIDLLEISEQLGLMKHSE